MKKCILFLAIILVTTITSYSQTISGNSIDYKAQTILKEVMKKAGVNSLTITSTNRTANDQVRVMFDYIKSNGVANANNLYGPEGKAVIKKYEEGIAKRNGGNKTVNVTDEQIKQMMLEELKRQLPSAIANNRLMHVGRENEFIVFDVDINSISPSNKLNDFEKIAKEFQSSGKIHRVLGRGQGEANAIHFEIKK